MTLYGLKYSVSIFYISIKKIQPQFFLDQSAPDYKLIRVHKAKNKVEDNTCITLIVGIYPVPSVLSSILPNTYAPIHPPFNLSIYPFSIYPPIHLLIIYPPIHPPAYHLSVHPLFHTQLTIQWLFVMQKTVGPKFCSQRVYDTV